MDNAYNNDACIDFLAAELGFNKQQRWVRCATHIFNLVAQLSLFGTDKDAFENGNKNLTEEQ